MPSDPRCHFDTDALASYLTNHLGKSDGELAIDRLPFGQSNPTFRLDWGERSIAMRTKPAPARHLLPSAHAIEREYRVMTALASTDVPVPRMLALCEDESVIGVAFYLMEYVEGRTLWDPALPGMSPAQRAAHYAQIGHVLSALHRVDVNAVGLTDFGKPGNYFERQIARWSRQYKASETQPIDAMHRLIEWLPRHIPREPREPTTLVHGDFRLDNLLWHPTEPRVLAVLDWELSTLGHPIADLSYYCMAWHIPPGIFRGMAGADIAALGIPREHDFIERYARSTGFTPAGPWEFYLAYNLFRIAAILQGVAKRAEQGSASSAQARDVGAQAKPLADLAWSFACRIGRDR
ncbi:MAG TPA: phosphotransferase family protein [Burkholderiaceae bacterium]|nr:phosphotransferase family protein [Burkholderiaceae bacterium]